VRKTLQHNKRPAESFDVKIKTSDTPYTTRPKLQLKFVL